MSELGGFGWLPPSVQRRVEAEERAEAREARRAEERAEARREAAHDAAVGSWRAAAQARGEDVSAVALVLGEAAAGRTVGDVFAAAADAADREDARARSRQRREDTDVEYIDREPVARGASRSDGWPESSRELDRLLREASELHHDLMAVRARYDYPGAIEAARSKADPFVERAAAHYGEITRTCSTDGMGQIGDVFGNVIR